MKPRRLIALATKECLQLRRDRRSLINILFMPIVLMILLGFGVNIDEQNLPLCSFDRDGGEEAADFLARFTASHYFRSAAVEYDYASIIRELHDNTCAIGVVIPWNFGRRLTRGHEVNVQILVDTSDDNQANIILSYAKAVVETYTQELQTKYIRRPGNERITHVSVETRIWYNEELKSRDFILPGVIVLVLTVIGTFLPALTIAREWERGTMEQLISTPVTPAEMLLGKLLPYFVIGSLDIGICSATGVFGFGVPFRGSVSSMFISSAEFLVVVLLLGFWLSAISRSQMAASQFTLVLTFLPALLVSGLLFPIDQMPVVVQIIASVLPARYYVSCLKAIFLKGVGLDDLWLDLLALGLFAVCLTGTALYSLRKALR